VITCKSAAEARAAVAVALRILRELGVELLSIPIENSPLYRLNIPHP
jgi:hypothetical protein